MRKGDHRTAAAAANSMPSERTLALLATRRPWRLTRSHCSRAGFQGFTSWLLQPRFSSKVEAISAATTVSPAEQSNRPIWREVSETAASEPKPQLQSAVAVATTYLSRIANYKERPTGANFIWQLNYCVVAATFAGFVLPGRRDTMGDNLTETNWILGLNARVQGLSRNGCFFVPTTKCPSTIVACM